ncbi:MAG TPA: P1 family peptidase [Acidimicrobiales bacterium]|nr:P1 family peptidase [Acidimicrobiales bacterium]
MITDVRGVRVGHWTDAAARTGCTVVVLPAGTVASGEVRGGAPGTREWELLAPERLVPRVDAVVLSGGSAFGLAACEGVVRWCEERGLGFPTAAGVVPIVVGAVLYDLAVGDAAVRPDAAAGYAACEAAASGPFEVGAVGAGTGARVGLGTAVERHGEVVVGAVAAVNAFGSVRGDRPVAVPDLSAAPFGHTTIGVIATNARLDKLGCLLVAQSGHDGLARALEPAHTTLDGDALVAAATGEVDGVHVDVVRMLAARAVEAAIRAA